MYIYIQGYCLDYGIRMWPLQRGGVNWRTSVMFGLNYRSVADSCLHGLIILKCEKEMFVRIRPMIKCSFLNYFRFLYIQIIG